MEYLKDGIPALVCDCWQKYVNSKCHCQKLGELTCRRYRDPSASHWHGVY